MQSMVDSYRQAVNQGCFVYSVNLSGHGQSQLRPHDDRTHLLSGWSEKLLDMIREIEAGRKEEPDQVWKCRRLTFSGADTGVRD